MLKSGMSMLGTPLPDNHHPGHTCNPQQLRLSGTEPGNTFVNFYPSSPAPQESLGTPCCIHLFHVSSPNNVLGLRFPPAAADDCFLHSEGEASPFHFKPLCIPPWPPFSCSNPSLVFPFWLSSVERRKVSNPRRRQRSTRSSAFSLTSTQ